MLDGLDEESCLKLLNSDIQAKDLNAPKLPVAGERNILVIGFLL